eukprot:UN08215
MKGRPGGLESYGDGGGDSFSNVECVNYHASSLDSWTGYNTRLMESEDGNNGMRRVNSRCSICCVNGCYTGLGTSSCSSGYTKVVSGVDR